MVLLGESYGGHYIPALGARIVAGNNNIQKGDVKIDLKGIAIGNGWVDPVPLALLFLLSFLPIFSPSILMWNSLRQVIQYGYYATFLNQAGLLDIVSTTAYNDGAYPICRALISGIASSTSPSYSLLIISLC